MSAKSEKDQKRQSGAVLIMFAVFLFLLLGFIAAGVEGGRWYLVRAELAKSVDAGALVGARNLSNPNVNPTTIAVEFARANFPAGSLGTPSAGTGSAAFTASLLDPTRVRVDGSASATSIFAQILGFGLVPVKGASIAQKRQVEIALLLDRSGSMGGTPMTELKKAANKFVDYFQTTQADDRMALFTFAYHTKIAHAMSINFATPIRSAISGMTADGFTNPEDCLDQADGPSGFTNQAGVAPQNRIAQFAIFFSDGRPNAFRANFIRQDVQYDWIVTNTGDCFPGDPGTNVSNTVNNPLTGAQINTNPTPTGDGKAAGSACGNTNSNRWLIMNTYPVPGYAPTACGINEAAVLGPYVCDMAVNLAIMHAQELKNAGITVYAIGLGDIDDNFMTKIATNANFYYRAPTPSDLQGIFQHIALEIRLRLVQ